MKALAAAARKGTSFGAPTELEVELGELVRKMMPSIEMVRFVSSGTEATMSAVRVARAHTRREKIIKFEGCYHGHGDQFLVQAGSGLTTLGVPTSPGVTRAAAADTLLATYNDVASVERLCESFPDQIAALIVEPIAGNMGVVLPEPRFLQGLRERVHALSHPADLRRSDYGISHRHGRRARLERRRSRPDVPRQDHRRRVAGRRVRRPRRSDAARRAGRVRSIRPARSRATRWR